MPFSLRKEKAILVDVRHQKDSGAADIEELSELVKSAGAEISRVITQEISKFSPSFLIGRGKAFEIAGIADELNSDLLVFNKDLKPVQQRNLEEVIGRKIIDRTGIILDIFAQRAKSREGKLQVELAQLVYLLPRLAGKGIELSRLGGGIGTRGPGEQKLEIDRRRIRTRIALLKREIEHLRTHRSLSRKARQDVPIPVAAIVGYTNAGKSTLMNALTNSDVFVEDKLFATLDPTTRKLKLPNGGEILLTDTVGFIKDLPPDLIAAFKATLEEVGNADILLHVIDISSENIKENIKVVEAVIKQITEEEKPTISVFNKIDKAKKEDEGFWVNAVEGSVGISALKKEGMNGLIKKIESIVSMNKEYIEVKIPYSEEKIRQIIKVHGNIIEENYSEKYMHIKAKVDKKLSNRLSKYK